MLLPFVRAHRLPFETLIRLYHVVIVPTVMYGLKVATLTKRNRMSLRRMERHMVITLRDLSRNAVGGNDIPAMLNGKTIIKKSRVQRLRYWGHVVRRPDRHILRKALHYHIPGKFKRGRPCFTWNETLRRDLGRTRDRNWLSTINDTSSHNAKCHEIFQDSDTDQSDY